MYNTRKRTPAHSPPSFSRSLLEDYTYYTLLEIYIRTHTAPALSKQPVLGRADKTDYPPSAYTRGTFATWKWRMFYSITCKKISQWRGVVALSPRVRCTCESRNSPWGKKYLDYIYMYIIVCTLYSTPINIRYVSEGWSLISSWRASESARGRNVGNVILHTSLREILKKKEKRKIIDETVPIVFPPSFLLRHYSLYLCKSCNPSHVKRKIININIYCIDIQSAFLPRLSLSFSLNVFLHLSVTQCSCASLFVYCIKRNVVYCSERELCPERGISSIVLHYSCVIYRHNVSPDMNADLTFSLPRKFIRRSAINI